MHSNNLRGNRPIGRRFSAAITNVMAAFVLTTGVASSVHAKEPQFDVCERQVERYVTDRLGLTIERIDYWWSISSGIRNNVEPSEAYVYVKGCSGFHHFDIRATGEECVLAHYGTPPDYLFYRGATGDCEAG